LEEAARSRAHREDLLVNVIVGRVTRNMGVGTFLNFARFVSGKFIASSRCCRVQRRESRKVRRERACGKKKQQSG
jgi:hypothetical protein